MENYSLYQKAKEENEKRYREESKKRYIKIQDKKMDTIIIGAIAAIENKLGFCWGNGKTNLTKTEQEFKKIWQELRTEILDKGNSQKRALHKELEQYELNWLRYTIELRIKDEE